MRRWRGHPPRGASPDALEDEEAALGEPDKYERSDTAADTSPCLLATDAAASGWLLALGLLTRFSGLNWPRQVVFDEVHFGKFVSGYITGRYFFDIHPPLGKLLIALAAWAGGYDGKQPFEHIGEV